MEGWRHRGGALPPCHMVGANKTKLSYNTLDEIANQSLCDRPSLGQPLNLNTFLVFFPLRSPRSLYHAQILLVRISIGRIAEKVNRIFLNLSFAKPIIERPNPHFQTHTKITFYILYRQAFLEPWMQIWQKLCLTYKQWGAPLVLISAGSNPHPSSSALTCIQLPAFQIETFIFFVCAGFLQL